MRLVDDQHRERPLSEGPTCHMFFTPSTSRIAPDRALTQLHQPLEQRVRLVAGRPRQNANIRLTRSRVVALTGAVDTLPSTADELHGRRGREVADELVDQRGLARSRAVPATVTPGTLARATQHRLRRTRPRPGPSIVTSSGTGRWADARSAWSAGRSARPGSPPGRGRPAGPRPACTARRPPGTAPPSGTPPGPTCGRRLARARSPNRSGLTLIRDQDPWLRLRPCLLRGELREEVGACR